MTYNEVNKKKGDYILKDKNPISQVGLVRQCHYVVLTQFLKGFSVDFQLDAV